MKHLLTLAATLSTSALAAPTLPAGYADNLKRAPTDQVCQAARTLTASQGDYIADSGGKTKATWEWVRGSGQAGSNAAGIVAIALARSEEVAPACGRKESLVRFADARVTEHARYEFLYDPDIEALALISKTLGEPKYLRAAQEAFARRYEGATGREIVERWFALKRQPALIGYDAALAIRAAVAVGDARKATEIADAIVSTMPRWGERADANGWLVTSRGSLLEALSKLDRVRYQPALRDLSHHLVLTQGSDGSWGTRNTQATAYAVIGLAASTESFAAAPAERGRSWLRLTQLRGGGWATFNDLLPEPFVGEMVSEVTAEAVLAVAAR